MRILICLVTAAAFFRAPAAVQPVRARHAMVVTREAHATEIGVRILEAGGNAVDAAVGVGFALAVTHPAAGNIGGGGFMLIRLADGRTTFLDFRERAPGRASHDMYRGPDGKATQDSLIGYLASGVPGTVRGLEYAAKKYGRKPWAELVAPAAELAEKGFPVSWGMAHSLEASRAKLARFAESNRIFLRNGKLYEPGEIFAQPELARTLGRLAREGARDFYEGETARRLAADMEAHGGLITPADLKNYAVVEDKPLAGSYRGYSILTAPPPSSGGTGVLQMLGVLAGSGYEKTGAGSAASLHFLAEAMRRYFADRSEYMGDAEFVKVPVSTLLDPRYIGDLRRSIDPARATPSAMVHPGKLSGYEATETTHYAIADAEGNVAAVTYTLNGGYGSAVTATGLGFLLNNEMDDFAPIPGQPNAYGLVQGEANAVRPGAHPLSSMTPTILLRNGRLYMTVGTPGGPTIINSVLQVIVNAADFGMNLQEAVNFPRIHHQWLPDELRMERGFSPDTIELLKARGHLVKIVNSIGEVAAIGWNDGWLEGAADPRTEATAKGY
jgi:gamma-glutamyltranspeptidase / glutathione hydrolase